MSNRRSAAGAAAVLVFSLGLAGCSSSGSDSQPSESASASASASSSASASASASADSNATIEFNKKVQEELNAVGCHAGPVDGVLGAETDAAIVRFQQASGLVVDGELGPQTDSALDKAAAAGETVCTASPTTSPSPSPTQTQSVKAPCTAEAVSQVLTGKEALRSYTCADAGDERWAAGKATEGNDPVEVSFFAQAEGDQWARVSSNEVCGTASAGLPPSILDYCSDGE